MIDKIKIIVRGGDGGDGVVSFRREKNVANGGPDGGDGGRGGDVYLESSEEVTGFEHLRYGQPRPKGLVCAFPPASQFGNRKPCFYGGSGEKGGKNGREGKEGEDLFIKVPVGTMGKFEGAAFDLREKGEKLLVAKGGTGGIGNARYWKIKLRETRKRPHGFWDRRERMLEAKPGEKGEEVAVSLELKLIADVGIVGLPNAGKSTLLSKLTKAKPKIADYPFTTIEPNLGVMPGYYAAKGGTSLVIADIPGLIEGASGGKGLGIDFLRHVSRTKILVHVLAIDDYEVMMKNYNTVREEIKKYDPELLKRREIVYLSKVDLAESGFVKTLLSTFSRHKVKVITGLEELKSAIISKLVSPEINELGL